MSAICGRGLSPRLRGNRAQIGDLHSQTGSIPAPAGEPRQPGPALSRHRVYPRACGGTFLLMLRSVRGSIPAGAGEPSRESAGRQLAGVYPRGRGGTKIGIGKHSGGQGLSPRARGNLERIETAKQAFGSIPAGAGEPVSLSRARRRPEGSIPAGAGEPPTSSARAARDTITGLSPRARGNPADYPRWTRPRRRVYPRGRGETACVPPMR